MGTLDEESRERLAAVLVAVTGRRTDDLVDALLDVGVANGRIDRSGLRTDLDNLLVRYYDWPLAEIPRGSLLQETLAIVRRQSRTPTLRSEFFDPGPGQQLGNGFGRRQARAGGCGRRGAGGGAESQTFR